MLMTDGLATVPDCSAYHTTPDIFLVREARATPRVSLGGRQLVRIFRELLADYAELGRLCHVRLIRESLMLCGDLILVFPPFCTG